MFIFIFYYLFQTAIISSVFHNPAVVIFFLIIAPASGFFALNYWKLYKEVKGMAGVIKQKQQVIELVKKRKEIIDDLKLFLK